MTLSNGVTTDQLTLQGLPAGTTLLTADDGHGGTVLFTPLLASDTASLDQDIAEANAATSGDIVIELTGDVTLSAALAAIDLQANVNLSISGGGHALDGNHQIWRPDRSDR